MLFRGKLKESLGFDDRKIVGERVEREHMQIVLSRLVVYESERSERRVVHPLRERDEKPSACTLACKFVVGLVVGQRAHLFELEVDHVVYTVDMPALVHFFTAKSYLTNPAPAGKIKVQVADGFNQASLFGEETYRVCTSGNPYLCFV